MIILLSFVLIFACMVSLALMMMPDVTARLIRQRIFSEVAEESRPTMLAQLADLLAPINRLLPTGWYGMHMWRKLETAGVKTPPMHFLVLQEIGALTGLFIYFVVLGGLGHLNVGWLILWLVAGFLVPYVWLLNRIGNRRMSISRDLPEVVDLLNLCIDAGIDFMNALTRVVREFRPCPTTEELGIVIQEVRVGKRRRDALRAFSVRVQTAEASSFSRTLIQADRMGTGIAEALQILSEDMRIQRYHWADRFAQQAPLKMLIPLICSLAAALIIVAGPILIQFLQSGFTAPFNPGQ